MRTNLKAKTDPVYTHEGAKAYAHLSPYLQLRRSVASCLLWEREFYEGGESIADRILKTAYQCSVTDVAALAVEARSKFNLRHVPLLLLVALVRMAQGHVVGDTIAATIQRADEMAEFLALYWKLNPKRANGKNATVTKQMRRGLGEAFRKFSAYSLGKYNRDGEVKMRDALFLSHANPKNQDQAYVWKSLVDGTLESPDTWEVALSAGADKKATFERLLAEDKLGYLALLRNLRNMEQAGCDRALIEGALLARKGAERVLPFRYIAAARHAPSLEPVIDTAMQAAISELPVLKGSTVVVVDVSGSMDCPLSAKSDLKRIDAAAALASVVNAEKLRVFSFSTSEKEVAPRRGMAGVDAVVKSQAHGGTNLGSSLHAIGKKVKHCDRLIVVTDEQSHDRVMCPAWAEKRYLINVASFKNGVGYGDFVHIDGFSESVLRFIHEIES